MRKMIAALAAAATSVLAVVATPTVAEVDLGGIVDGHVLPRYQALAAETATLAGAAEADCKADSDSLRDAYGTAFDAWVGVSHLRFGPSEEGDRAFALAYWPDPRGSTPKALGSLIRDADPVVESLDGFAEVSIAARGFYAMEFLLFETALQVPESAAYRCVLTKVMAADMARTSAAILDGWQGGYADLMREAGQNDTYRTRDEALRQMFTALSTGLEFTADTRIGRPMGTFDQPRPARAEARRAERSLRHVILSLEALRDLGARLSEQDADLDAAFARALSRAETLGDPVFAGVADPMGRIRVEALQQAIGDIRTLVSEDLGPRLGIAAGFNSLDGD
ncbi:imelysin family protein [Antarctobacter jejuensis]|uniref:imelysin family protein n=1 Tax=Antarctobacter jejuensis TaxID=1439938 RepID=UPI003FD5B101